MRIVRHVSQALVMMLLLCSASEATTTSFGGRVYQTRSGVPVYSSDGITLALTSSDADTWNYGTLDGTGIPYGQLMRVSIDWVGGGVWKMYKDAGSTLETFTSVDVKNGFAVFSNTAIPIYEEPLTTFEVMVENEVDPQDADSLYSVNIGDSYFECTGAELSEFIKTYSADYDFAFNGKDVTMTKHPPSDIVVVKSGAIPTNSIPSMATNQTEAYYFTTLANSLIGAGANVGNGIVGAIGDAGVNDRNFWNEKIGSGEMESIGVSSNGEIPSIASGIDSGAVSNEVNSLSTNATSKASSGSSFFPTIAQYFSFDVPTIGTVASKTIPLEFMGRDMSVTLDSTKMGGIPEFVRGAELVIMLIGGVWLGVMIFRKAVA